MPAKIDMEKCQGSGECVEVCPLDAIAVQDGKAKVDEETCGDCGACVDACPNEAITVD